jgi:hypothetical protein
MKLPLALFAVLLVSTGAIAADKKAAAKPKPCPKGEIATHLETWNGKLVCAKPQGMMMAAPVQPAKGGPVKGGKVTAPVLTKTN